MAIVSGHTGDQALEAVYNQMRNAVPIKDRTWMGMMYKACANASEMLDWLERQPFCGSRKAAVALCVRLQMLDAIVHVWGFKKLRFTDATLLFRFADLTSASLPSFDTWSSISSNSSRASGPVNSIGKMKTGEQNFQRFAKGQVGIIGEDDDFGVSGPPGELRFKSMKYHPQAAVPPAVSSDALHATRRVPRVAVIGGGISGLSVAWKLLKDYGNHVSVRIFEHKSTLDGNCVTVEGNLNGAKGVLDVGACDFNRLAYPMISKICDELGIQLGNITNRNAWHGHDGKLLFTSQSLCTMCGRSSHDVPNLHQETLDVSAPVKR